MGSFQTFLQTGLALSLSLSLSWPTPHLECTFKKPYFALLKKQHWTGFVELRALTAELLLNPCGVLNAEQYIKQHTHHRTRAQPFRGPGSQKEGSQWSGTSIDHRPWQDSNYPNTGLNKTGLQSESQPRLHGETRKPQKALWPLHPFGEGPWVRLSLHKELVDNALRLRLP